MSATGQHIPAWKRLGLTLKHAKDVPESAQSSIAESPAASGKKSKRAHEDSELSHDHKKRKLGNEPDMSTPSKNQSLARPSPAKQLTSSIRKSPTKPSDRRKSVSFSQDTKTEDGDTGMNAFRDWVAQQNALEIEAEEAAARERANSLPDRSQQDPPKQPSPSQEPTGTVEPAATAKKSKSEKTERTKSEKTKSKSTAEPAHKKEKVRVRAPKTEDRPVAEYVRYLEQYHNDRLNWKFNKSKQNDLLKNVWNIYRVPSELDDALVAYIDGLQGAARQRVQDSARTLVPEIVQFIRREIPEASADAMDTLEARKAALEAAEKREVDAGKSEGDRAQALRQKQQEDERATRLLKTLLGEAAMNQTSASAPTKEAETTETARSRKKKRRSRTAASDSDSSSDDSDSDSGSAPPSKKKAKTTNKSETSDDSSSSSSESDSDSSSDSSSDSGSDSDSSSSGSSDSDSSDSDGSSDDSSSSESEDGSSDSDSD